MVYLKALLMACAMAAEAFSPSVPVRASLRRLPSAQAPPMRKVHSSRRSVLQPCRMQMDLFSQPKATDEIDDPFNPVRPDPATMSPKIVMLMEDMGAMKDGQWLSEEELLVEWRKLYPDWQVAAWPLGSIDVGAVDARDRLMIPELGGDPFAWPMGEPPKVICVGEMLIDAIANDASVKPGDPDEKWTAFAGGAPCNVACALAKLGTPVGFIGAVGNDADGAKLLEVLKQSNLPLQMVQVGRNRKIDTDIFLRYMLCRVCVCVCVCVCV